MNQYMAVASHKFWNDHHCPGETYTHFRSGATGEVAIKTAAVHALKRKFIKESILFQPNSFNMQVFRCEFFAESGVGIMPDKEKEKIV